MKASKTLNSEESATLIGAPERVKKIHFQDIANILDFAEISPDNVSPIYYKDWAMRSIESLGNNIGEKLVDHISISIAENIVTVHIKNLHLLVNGEVKIAFSPSFTLCLMFRNNTFENQNEPHIMSHMSPKILFDLHGEGIISFRNNEFKDVGLIFQANDSSNSRYVQISNNIIFSITAPAHAQIFLEKRNIIEKINIFENEKDSKFGIKWSQNQVVDNKGRYVEFNRESFIVLKARAVRKGDKLQEALINREILKCDDWIIKEKTGLASWQDRAIMWFGRISSDHGISWLRPMLLLFFMNMLLTAIAVYIAKLEGIHIEFYDSFHIWAEMLNPLSNLGDIMKIEGNTIISIINAVQKGVLALLIYEAIRVGRRFTPK